MIAKHFLRHITNAKCKNKYGCINKVSKEHESALRSNHVLFLSILKSLDMKNAHNNMRTTAAYFVHKLSITYASIVSLSWMTETIKMGNGSQIS